MTSQRRAWSAFASGGTPQDLAKACVEQLDGMVNDANLGLIFLSGRAAEMADEIVAIIKSQLKIECWFGGCGAGIIAGNQDFGDESGLAVLCLAMPPASTQLVRAGMAADDAHSKPANAKSDDAKSSGQTIWLYAPAEHEQIIELTAVSAQDYGGVCDGQGEATLILNQPMAGGAIGLRCQNGVRLLGGMSRGTRDLGPWRRITSSVGGCIMELDGQPATRLVEADTGELLARQPEQLIKQVIVETADDGEANLLMPRLALIERFDRVTGRLHIRDHRPGSSMRLVYRQAAPAKLELAELARALTSAVEGGQILAALLFSSSMRGEKLFGPGNQEPQTLMAELGGIPLIGLRTSDEFYQGQLICGAAVLVLIVADQPTQDGSTKDHNSAAD